MMTPRYEGAGWSLYVGDALAVLRELPDDSADAVVTDPPYSSGGQYRADRMLGVHAKYLSLHSGYKALAAFAGDNRDQRAYGYWCALWLAECLRVVRPGGVVAMFTDWRQLPTTTDALQAGGWVWRGIVPWYKPSARPQLGRFTAACEYVVWGSKGPMRQDATIGALPGFYTASAPRAREHVTQKPLDVMCGIVKIVPRGGVVLDPFAGAGTTGVAALVEGRRFVGVEIVSHYAEVAAARMRAAEREDPEEVA